MLIDNMKSEEVRSLGNSICSLATGTYLDKLFLLPTFPSYSAASEHQYDSAVGDKMNLISFLFMEYMHLLSPGKKDAVSRKTQLWADYGSV